MKLRAYRTIAVFLSINILLEIFVPSVALALTGGPSQPEMAGFQPVGVSDMVDLKTGDFSYNIPLVDVGGYPLNIVYNAGASMDEEASWVGLGWSLNPGVMTRSLKGIPDDHRGELVTKQMNIKPDITTSIQLSKPIDLEALGLEIPLSISKNYELSYNNYRGIDFGFGYGLSYTFDMAKGTTMTAGLGFSGSQKKGMDITPSVGFGYKIKESGEATYSLSAKAGLPFNSRQGLKQLTLSAEIDNMKKNAKGTNFGTSYGLGSEWTFVRSHMAPSFEMPRNFRSFSAFLEIGKTTTIMYKPRFGVTVNYSQNALAQKEKSTPSYGSMYSHWATKTTLMDFHREKDGPIGPNSVATGVAIAGQDDFVAQGQGISGAYKVHSRNLGTFYDPYIYNRSSRTIGAGVELGYPDGTGGVLDGHIGIDVQMAYSNSHQGKWDHNRLGELDFDTDPYIGSVGENVPLTTFSGYVDDNALTPSAFELVGGANGAYLNGYLQNNKGNFQGNIRKGDRIRNNALTHLTAEQADKYSVKPKSYGINTVIDPRNNAFVHIERVDIPVAPGPGVTPASRKQYHLSEMSVTSTDGSIYTYGIPAYNHKQKEVTFSIGKKFKPNYSTGLVEYEHNDVSPDLNKNGQENYVEAVQTKGYAHSFLLTEIKSSDYIDRTGNGASDDDFGTYTKFNYSRVHDAFEWRVPVEKDQATHSEGLKSIDYSESRSDDKANYIYGQKEIWMMHSIETKTHKAYFILDDTRGDGKGVINEHGGRNDNLNLYSLKRIDLYTKEELKKQNPVPIKSVHFVYSKDLANMEDLCPGVSNSTSPKGGKLTLVEMYFTYGTSYKGKFSSYRFSYASNYPYNIKGYDRWGTYKFNTSDPEYRFNGDLTTSEFPYTKQDKAQADQYASAWCLNRIELPSGGVIEVQYESDDYAYVQDEKAMQMYTLNGAYKESSQTTYPDGNKNSLMVFDGPSVKNHEYIFFNLKEPITDPEIFRKQYLQGVRLVYFKCLVNIGNIIPNSNAGEFLDLNNEQFEYISGYAEYDGYGVTGDGKQGWLKLKLKGIKADESNGSAGDQVHPITKAGWQFARVYRPEVVYGMIGSNADQTNLFSIAGLLLGSINSTIETFRGINKSMRHKGLSFQFIPGKSMIRLNTPDGHKLGGGHRVKQISISDNWSSLSGGNETASYGQKYDYTLPASGNISSGVASYEPLLGGEENPLRKPYFATENNLLVPDDVSYSEGPFGEGYYPSPQVIYSEVKVTSLNNTYKSSNTGYVVNSFYTTKDFPTISKKTTLTPKLTPKSLVFRTFFRSRDHRTYTQGFSVEINKIAGLPKSTFVYDRNGNQLSGVSYHYKTENRKEVKVAKRNGQIIMDPVYKTTLSNKLNVLKKTPSGGSYLGESELGVEIESFSDSREYQNLGRSIKGHFNIDPVFFPVGFFLGILPLVPYDKEDIKLRIVTNIKVIYRNPILEKVIAYEDGSAVETSNLLYDEKTGEVLLTRTTNQFGDNVFNFTYPAHLAYDRMGHAYQNQGYKFDGVSFPGVGASQLSNFVIGDELRLLSGNSVIRAWVANVDASGVHLIDKDNQSVQGTYQGIVFRSGRKNLQSTPVGTVTTLSDPRIDSNGDRIPDALSFSQVLNAAAVEFSENWKTYCECDMSTGTKIDFQHFNPYLFSDKGNWRVKRSYAYLTERTQKIQNDNTDIRHDGVFKYFNPFWVPSSSGDWSKDASNWQYVTEVTNYSPMGFELENKDALGRFSSASYGYNALLPIAVHNNSKYEQSVAEGFEDYKMSSPCALGKKVNYMIHESKISDAESHTGRYSIKVQPNQTVKAYNKIDYCTDEE